MQPSRFLLVLSLAVSCPMSAIAQIGFPTDPPITPIVRRPNVLVVVADDVGVDMLRAYDEGFEFACIVSGNQCSVDSDCPVGETCVANYPPTPNIDQLVANGILFRNAWNYPTCSPMRAAANTGRYGFRTGVGFAGHQLMFPEIIIPEALSANPGNVYTHAAIGKWHIGGGVTGPNTHGYSHFAGTVANIGNYFGWPYTVNGSTPVTETTYATTKNVDDALTWINQQTTPWFMWLAFNAPHFPFHAPPANLHSYHGGVRPPLPENCAANRRLCYCAMLEALDTELGRLLNSLPLSVRNKTTVIFIGDNGSDPQVTRPPFIPGHAKFTVYEGGINVPLIISGANVAAPNRKSDALVSAVDLFATALRLAGITNLSTVIPAGVELDTVSLWPILRNTSAGLREFVYSEQFSSPGTPVHQAIRNVRGYKLSRHWGSVDNLLEFFDLTIDPFEANDLYDDSLMSPLDPLNAEQLANYDALLIEMNRLLGLWPVCPAEFNCTPAIGCSTGGLCTAMSTGTQACELPTGAAFGCPSGQTVHVRRCNCNGPVCATATDAHLVCQTPIDP